MDLYAASKTFDDYGNMVIGTGIAVEIPKGYVGLVFPRSSICQHYCYMPNSVGVIDSDFRGEITFKFAARAIRVEQISFRDRLRTLLFGVKRNKPMGTCGFYNFFGNEETQQYNIGDRIGQLIIMPYPKVQLVESDELSQTDRGTGGYGSTGK
jgi:dUTP pyrophosphatase